MRVRLIARIKNDHFYSARIASGYHRMRDLAAATGIGLSTLYGFENFKLYPRRSDTIRRVEAALGVSAGELFPWDYMDAVDAGVNSRAELVKSVRTLPMCREALLLPAPENPEKTYEASELNGAVQQALSYLSPREAHVLKLRFGIGECGEYTLQEVAERLHVSRERIRQVEAKALRKLKHPSRSRQLKHFAKQ